MNPEEKLRYKSRLWIFYGIIFTMLGSLLVGLAYRQIWLSESYEEKKWKQNYLRILTPGPRGNIYDREGRLLVSNTPQFSAVIFLADKSVRSAAYKEYNDLLDEHQASGDEYDAGNLRDLGRAKVVQEYLDDINLMLGRDEKVNARELSRHAYISPLLPYHIIKDLTREEFAILIESLPVESPIQIYASTTRHYPYESAAAHTLGYAVSNLLTPTEDLEGNELKTFASKGIFGRSGVEKYYDDILQGKMGSEIWIRDPKGYKVELVQREAPQQGQDLQLSLDIDLQLVAEQGFDAYEDIGAMVVLDIETMEILAMASKPDYNLNDTSPFLSFATAKEIEAKGAWQNKAVQGLYPPGSPFKLITAVAGLKAGIIDPNETVLCTGSMQIGNARFVCHNRAGHGETDLANAIRASCNVYFYTMGLRMGIDRLSSEAIFLGMDNSTGIDLPHETQRMLVPTKEWKKEQVKESWYPGNTAHVSIGQGYLRFTPLQMAMTVASVATNKVVTQPTILKRTESDLENMPARKSLGLPIDLHRAILKGMSMAVNDGTAKLAKVEGIEIGGKTGTAEVAVPGGKIELAWFVAVAPVEDPKIALCVLVEGQELNADFHGGSFAAPLAQPVLQALLQKRPELETKPITSNSVAFSSN